MLHSATFTLIFEVLLRVNVMQDPSGDFKDDAVAFQHSSLY